MAKLSKKAKDIIEQTKGLSKLGDLRKIAKEIKVDHELGLELWSSGEYMPMMLSLLIMDKKVLDNQKVNAMIEDIEGHDEKESLQLVDWLLGNQLMKHKKFAGLMDSWVDDKSPLKRRIFWFHQSRLRWTGKTAYENTDELVDRIEKNLSQEDPEVQWAMNMTAGWIGIYDKKYRDRLIDLGEMIGLYKGDHVSPGCTPNYLPEFIEIEVEKRNL